MEYVGKYIEWMSLQIKIKELPIEMRGVAVENRVHRQL